MSDSNRARFVEMSIRQDLETVLDIGAETGVFTIPLVHNAKRVVAIEPSTEMPDILQKKDREEGLSRIECINRT